MNWAKFHAGVVQRTAHWTEEERARVCQHLSGVINHVRLLLIGKRQPYSSTKKSNSEPTLVGAVTLKGEKGTVASSGAH